MKLSPGAMQHVLQCLVSLLPIHLFLAHLGPAAKVTCLERPGEDHLVLVPVKKTGYHRVREYCESESFRPRCGSNEVIVMETATYGRMRLGRCVTTDLGYLGCASNVLSVADSRCSGRRQCQIRIPHPEMDATQPCFKELKIYLTASYSCIPVLTPKTTHCHGNQVIRVQAQWGYLASVTAFDTGCGTPQAPWVMEAPEGHRFNLTLFDFMAYGEHQARYFPAGHRCYEYGEVVDGGPPALEEEAAAAGGNQHPGDQAKDQGADKKKQGARRQPPSSSSVPICRGSQRAKHIILSKSNRVTITLGLSKKDANTAMFIVRYEVIGCKYNGDCATDLPTEPCVGKNCTIHTSSSYHGRSSNLHFLGQGASIAIILCISMAVSLLMLVLGAALLKCHKLGRGPFAHTRSRHLAGTEQDRRACAYSDHVDYSGAALTGLTAREYEIRTCYFDPRCREYLATATTTATATALPSAMSSSAPAAAAAAAGTAAGDTSGKELSQMTSLEPYVQPTRRTGGSAGSNNGSSSGAHKTTCTLEMETTSGLVLRGVLSKMDDADGTCELHRGTHWHAAAPDKDECTKGGQQDGGADNVNLYLFSDTNKLHEGMVEYTPENERKVMVI